MATASVISDRTNRRKRRGALAYLAPRLLALGLTIGVMTSASEIARLLRPAAPAPSEREQPLLQDSDFKRSAAYKVLNLPPLQPVRSAARRRARQPAPAPANAPADEGYVVLSAEEMAAISQARD